MPATAQATELGAFAASRTHGGDEGGDALSGLLRPTIAPAVAASVLPTRRFLLAKGAFIDCTLETAIDSTLPGMTTCVTATDTFSADGSVVLLERGTKLVGETRGQVAQGTSRIFVLWTEARTPTGVVVPLSSPGTDELGRSGLTGDVNRHFWDRFGAAILLTVINGAVQGAVASQNQGSSVIVSPSTTSDVMTEVLKSTLNIPPTVSKAQGDRIQVFVARDVDFRPVYALEVANAAQPGRTP
jgi:type IV secretory pathway VirB10-like protein